MNITSFADPGLGELLANVSRGVPKGTSLPFVAGEFRRDEVDGVIAWLAFIIDDDARGNELSSWEST